MKVENVERLLHTLRARAAASAKGDDVSVVVGYEAQYAIYVHENLEARHKPGKQAKYLEQPARELQDVFKDMIREAAAKGRTIGQALLLCGLKLQRESMKIVPVDTGNLRASAFTRLEKKKS